MLSADSQSGRALSQSANPAWQVTGPQAPFTQAALPLSTAQLLPQAPQFPWLMVSGVSHPGLVVQSPNPA